MPRHLFVLAALICASALTARADLIHDYNLVVTGNLQTTSETEGRAIIGGNLTGNATQFGFKLSSGTSHSSDTLTVGGNVNINGAVTVSVGDAKIGGSLGSGTFINAPGGYQAGDSAVAGIGITAAAELRSDSSYFAGLTANSTYTKPGSQPAAVTFNAVPNAAGVAIFNIDGSIFSNSLVQQYQLNANGATSFIFNVSGTSINFNQGNFVGSLASSTFSSEAIFNFYQATSLSFTNHFYGAVLAPSAAFTNSTAIEGSVFVKSFTQNGEVHLPTYTGVGVAAVPEPASIALLGLGGLGVVAVSRRRN